MFHQLWYALAPIGAKINQCHFGESRLFVTRHPKYALTFGAGQKTTSAMAHGTVVRLATVVIWLGGWQHQMLLEDFDLNDGCECSQRPKKCFSIILEKKLGIYLWGENFLANLAILFLKLKCKWIFTMKTLTTRKASSRHAASASSLKRLTMIVENSGWAL